MSAIRSTEAFTDLETDAMMFAAVVRSRRIEEEIQSYATKSLSAGL